MTTLAGAYLLWRIARRLAPLLAISGVAIVLLAPSRQQPGASRHPRQHAAAGAHHAQRGVDHAFEGGLRRR
jgi:hypothetical protein